MKKLSFILLVAVAAFFSSCDKFTNLTIPAPLSRSIDFNIDSTTGTSVDKVITINLSDVPALEQYLDQIDGLTIKSIKLEITNYADSSSKNCILNGTVKYSSIDSTNGIDLATITNVNLNDLFVNQTKYECPGVVAEYQNAANELKTKQSLKIYLNGIVSEWPAYGTVKVTVETEAKVQLIQ